VTVYDIAILAILVLTIITGAGRGFSRSFFDLIGLVAGLAAAYFLSPLLVPYLPTSWSIAVKIGVVGIVLFVFTSIGVDIIGWWVRKSVVKGPLKVLDRLAGGILGTIKGILFVVAVVMLVSLTPYGKNLEDAAKRSTSFPLKTSLAMAKPLAQYLSSWSLERIQKQAQKTLPASTVDNLSTGQVQQLLAQADQLRDEGKSEDEIVQALTVAENGRGQPPPNPKAIREIVAKSTLIKSEGMTDAQIAQAMTAQDVMISPGVVREVVASLQTIQASGQPISKDVVLAGLSPGARTEVENALNTLKVRKIDPITFAKETGMDLEELARQFGLQDLYTQFRQHAQ